MGVEKEVVDVGKVDSGLASVLSKSCERFVEERSRAQDAEGKRKEEGVLLQEVLTARGWLDKRVLAGGYEATFVSGVSLDRTRFNDFLEARGVGKALLSKAWKFASCPTAGSVRVRRV